MWQIVTRLSLSPSDTTQACPSGHTPLHIGASVDSHGVVVGHSLLQLSWVAVPFTEAFSDTRASEALTWQSVLTSQSSSVHSSFPTDECRMNKASEALGTFPSFVTGRPQSPACTVPAAIVKATADKARNSFCIYFTSPFLFSFAETPRSGGRDCLHGIRPARIRTNSYRT